MDKNHKMKATTHSNYWQSLEAKPSSFDEFSSTPLSKDLPSKKALKELAIERRDFLKLMGAGLALTSTSCIRRPVEKIVPYANRPEEIEPGIANYYCSTYTSGGEGQNIVVKTREGRPIYLTGNSKTPIAFDGVSLQAQAHILDLYDPDRLKSPCQIIQGSGLQKSKSQKITWDKLDEAVRQSLKEGNVGLLTGSLSSPSAKKLAGNFLTKFSGKHYIWDPVGADDVMEGQAASFGQAIVPRFRFDQAELIVSVGADFLGTWLTPQRFSSDFAKGRRPGRQMNKLVVFEALHSLTGANADLRLKVPPSQFLNVVMALIYEIVVKNKQSSFANDPQILAILNQFADALGKTSIDPKVIAQLAKDLWKKRGQSLVVAGGLTARTHQAKALQVATNFLNTILENEGRMIDPHVPITSFNGSYEHLKALTEDLQAGRIQTLIIAGVNSIYASPSFQKVLRKAKTVVYVGDRLDETALMADFVAPLSHQMEAWGDAEFLSGIYSIQQPTIRPLYETRCLEENLLAWQKPPKPTSESDDNTADETTQTSESSEDITWHAYLKEQWKGYHQALKRNALEASSDFEAFWIDVLHKGFAITKDLSSKSPRRLNVNSLSLLSQASSPKQDGASLELALYVKSTGDGHQANNAWLQEMPDPITKVVWDNYLLISAAKAKQLGFTKSGEHAQLTANSHSVVVPVLMAPGIHDEVVGLAVGYGRSQAGRVGTGVGVNAYPYVKDGVFSGLKASVVKVDGFTALANVQGHHSMHGRQLVVEATLQDYLKSPSANIHRHKLFSLYPKHEYKGHRWGMAIDLNACTGCSACTVACQSENNVPSVGKKYVLQGREMHWIRVDRYYTGSKEDPDVVFQPMLCQHCENASCEAVCPVAATVHGEEGLNQMAYNRCVGTRYCSNNCPYKVRRFNWFNYSKVEDPLKEAYNPDVTVRTRGVMEKCTFCTQRIKGAKILAKREDRVFKGEDVVTACQEACPTNAIVFGDVNDPKSRISQVFKDARSFGVLEEYNNVPMVRYQTKIRNKDKLKNGGHH